MASSQINSLTPTKENLISKLSLGAASIMMLTIVGSTSIAGATAPTTGEVEASESSQAQATMDREHGDKSHGDKDKPSKEDCKKEGFLNFGQCNKEHEHGKNHGHHGYGGQNNSVETNVSATQNGHDNVMTVIINYFFG